MWRVAQASLLLLTPLRAVCVSARTLLLWSRNPLQVVYTDSSRPADCSKRFAYAHGTLCGHLLVRHLGSTHSHAPLRCVTAC